MKSNCKWLGLIPIRSVMFLLVFCGISLLSGRELSELSRWWSVIASAINLVTIGILFAVARSEKTDYLKLIGYEKGKTKFPEAIAIPSVMLLGGFGFMCLAGYIAYGVFPYMAPMMIAPVPLTLAVVNVLVLPLSTTLAEDGLYLGCGVNRIKSKWLAVLYPAFFYALQHSFIPTIFDFRYMLYRFLSFLPLTAFICLWYYKKRNPLPIMIGHIILNIATAAQILLTSAKPELYAQMLNM